MIKEHDLRGSVKMIRDRWNKPLQPEHLDHVVELLDRHGVQVRDILCVGIPAPEAITGSVTTKPEALGPLTQDLLRLEDARLHGLEVFPIGIPWPELLEVRFEIGR